MTRSEFDSYCNAMTGTSHVVQWGGASVWKVGGKIFALCASVEEEGFARISFKCSDIAFEILPEQDGIIPAPYLARAKWVQLMDPDAMNDEDIKLHLDAAHAIVASRLTRKIRQELGIELEGQKY